jgi:hypothetical protein
MNKIKVYVFILMLGLLSSKIMAQDICCPNYMNYYYNHKFYDTSDIKPCIDYLKMVLSKTNVYSKRKDEEKVMINFYIRQNFQTNEDFENFHCLTDHNNSYFNFNQFISDLIEDSLKLNYNTFNKNCMMLDSLGNEYVDFYKTSLIYINELDSNYLENISKYFNTEYINYFLERDACFIYVERQALLKDFSIRNEMVMRMAGERVDPYHTVCKPIYAVIWRKYLNKKDFKKKKR